MGGPGACIPRFGEDHPKCEGVLLRDAMEACQMDPDIDPDRIDEAVLALLWLGRHEGWRTWKGFEWDAMERLHRKGMISDPVGKAKSVVFTEQGRREAERLFRELFSRRP